MLHRNHECCNNIAMNKHQEQRANKEVALKRPAGEQAHAGDAAEELRVSFAKIKIEAYNRTRAARQAVIDCELDHSQMTEACVRDLGFSLETGGGEKRRTLTLLLGAPEEPHTFRVTFLIVAEAKHDIVLNEAAADELHESSRGTNYPVFAVPGKMVEHFALQQVGGMQ